MSDQTERAALVKRLRNTPNWMRESYGSWKDCVLTYDRAPFEAADAIEQLDAAQPAAEPLSDALAELVAALDATNWSSWQTTAQFSKELENARAVIATHEAKR